MTDITLGLPTGGFYWRGGVPGPLCGATVTWTCTYESTEVVAIPPFIDFFGPNVVVTNVLPECESVPSYVSPGVLTLTPTVTCPNPDPEQPPVVTVLDPLYLTITEGGCSASGPPCVPSICPFPENPGFEDGTIYPAWDGYFSTLQTTIVHSGAQAVLLGQNGYVRQTKPGACPDPPRSFDVSFYVYCPNADSSVGLRVIQYDETSEVDDHTVNSDIFPIGQWTYKVFSRPWHADTNRVQIRIIANDPDIYIDDVACDIC